MFAQIAKYSALALAAATLLTGCTPPPPPEVLAAWAEQSPTCIEGEASAYFPREIGDVALGLVGSISLSCDGSDPEKLALMGATVTDSLDSANIVVATDGDYGKQKAYSSVPWAIDGAVLVANLPENSGLNLTPAVAQGILDGSISDWSDDAIAKANPNEAFSSGPITVVAESTENAIDAFSNWMSYLSGKSFDAKKLKAGAIPSVAAITNLPVGGITLVPLSVKSEFDLNAILPMLSANIIVGKDPNNPELDLPVAPDAIGVASAATQVAITKNGDELVGAIDHSLTPIPPAGADFPDPAYGAIFVINMKLVGIDTLLSRAVARFLLRQDSQGLVGSSYLLPLASATRIEALAAVSKGLPQPVIADDSGE